MDPAYVRMLREASKKKLEETKQKRLAKVARLEEKGGEASVAAALPEFRAPVATFEQTYAAMRAKVVKEKQAAPPSLGSLSDRGYDFVQEEISTAVGPSVEEEEVQATTAPASGSASAAEEAVDRVIQKITDQTGGEDDVVEIVPPVEVSKDLLAGSSSDPVAEEKEAEMQEMLPRDEAIVGEARTETPIDVLDSLLALKAVGQNPTVIPGPDTNLSLCTPPRETPAGDTAREDPVMAMLQSVVQSTSDLSQRMRNMEEMLLARADVPASSVSAPVENFRMGVRFYHELLVKRGIVSPDVLKNDEIVKFLLWFLNLQG